jgi:hypothetical protein
MAKITIINPRFEISFWGLEHCMPLFGKKANLPVANLALLAALVPKHHDVTLIDENVEDLDFDRVAEADLVCLTGMSIQGRRLIEIVEKLKARGVTVVVGGPSYRACRLAPPSGKSGSIWSRIRWMASATVRTLLRGSKQSMPFVRIARASRQVSIFRSTRCSRRASVVAPLATAIPWALQPRKLIMATSTPVQPEKRPSGQ